MNMFQNYFKKRKIKKFATILPPALKSRYGYQEHYTKKQVDTIIKQKKLSKHVSVTNTPIAGGENCYAYAMFCSPEEFQQIHATIGEVYDYHAMRSEVSTTCFGEDVSFSFNTLLTEANLANSSGNGFSSDGGSGFNDGGGFGGGGDGGG